MTGSPSGAPAPTETSPLLRSSDAEPANGGVIESARQNDDAARDDKRDGNPEMAKKMHVLLPAIGIGVSLRPRPRPRYRHRASLTGTP